MWKDPIVEEVRKAREEYAARFNYDLGAMLEDLRKAQGASGCEVVSLKPRRPAARPKRSAKPAAAEPLTVSEDEADYGE